jgi:hypothetical protein
MKDMGVTNINAFRDSQLVVQHVRGESQCLDSVLNAYHDRCVDIIKTLDSFQISHVSRRENVVANRLAQQASGYEVTKRMFWVQERPTLLGVLTCDGESAGGNVIEGTSMNTEGATWEEIGKGGKEGEVSAEKWLMPRGEDDCSSKSVTGKVGEC